MEGCLKNIYNTQIKSLYYYYYYYNTYLQTIDNVVLPSTFCFESVYQRGTLYTVLLSLGNPYHDIIHEDEAQVLHKTT